MPAYLVARIAVHDNAGFADYRDQVTPVIAAHGGRYVVRGGAVETLEGDAPTGRLVIVEFPSMDAARRFYHSADYAPVLQLRLASAASEVVLVEGSSPG
jgi:uncharacterized protein (DUF1330 family)